MPETAAFVRLDSGSAFICTMEQVGEQLVDGTLSLSVNNQDQLIRFRNELKDCAYYSLTPEQVEVLTCKLSWQMDSKGFYRPVYAFSCSLDGKAAEDFCVPAMKG